MKFLRFNTMRTLLCFFSLLPLSIVASEKASLGLIRMHMRSTANSDPEHFPIRVLSQTFLFLDQVFKNVYADMFERFSLSINSRGIKPDDTGGYVVAVDLSGTAHFADGSNVLEEEVMSVLKDGFRKYNDLYLEILADSVDPFLSEISYAVVIVDGEGVVDIIVPDAEEDKGLEVWAIAAIAAGAGFFSILTICLLFICCLGDLDDDEYPVPERTKSNVSKKSKTTTATSRGEEESVMFGKDHLETRSISSQDSSKFTYNPKSIRSNDGFTFASFNTNSEYDIDSWQKASTINRSVAAPFGQDISAIESKKDLSHIVERDEESGNSSADHSGLRGLHIKHDDDPPPRQSNGGRHSLDLSGAAQDVIEDLNDLSRQVAQYRKSS